MECIFFKIKYHCHNFHAHKYTTPLNTCTGTLAYSLLHLFFFVFLLLDIIDIVRDPIPSGDYKKEEDPKLFRSVKTGRGPLDESWRDSYTGSNRKGKAVMCAYKLCRVEFKYWGMQNKIERFIHDVGEQTFCRLFILSALRFYRNNLPDLSKDLVRCSFCFQMTKTKT